MQGPWGVAGADAVDLGGSRILIVEDEVIVAFNMECEISDAGGTIVGPAHSLNAARELLDETIDAAVLDINIAGELVWPIAQALRERGVPFVLASANCKDSNAVGLEFASIHCFDKPVAMRDLLATLAKITSGRRVA